MTANELKEPKTSVTAMDQKFYQRLIKAKREGKGVRLSPKAVEWLVPCLSLFISPPKPERKPKPKPVKGTRLRTHIRWMIRRDMPEVLEIERESFEEPMSEEQIIQWLRQRNCIGMVAELGERVIAYFVYELHKTRLVILNLAVAKDVRGREVGRQCVEKLQSKLSGQRRTRIDIEVPEENIEAMKFFKACGMRASVMDDGIVHMAYHLQVESES